MVDIITTVDKLKCAERELALRKRVYANRLETGRMSAGKIAHELACMEAIIGDYKEQAARERLL